MNDEQEPQYGQKATPEQPGTLNGHDYYPGQPGGTNQPASGGPGDAYDPHHTLPPMQGNHGSGYQPINSGMAGGGGDPFKPDADLPSRRWPIAVTVIGAVTMVVLAPIVFFAMIMGSVSSAVGLDNPGESPFLSSVESGDVVTMDKEGKAIVFIEKMDSWNCTFTNEDTNHKTAVVKDSAWQDADPMNEERSWSGIAHLKAGDYRIDCVNDNNQPATGMRVVTDQEFLDVGKGALTAFTVATTIGFIGMGLLIWGIIWLVKRNKERKIIVARRAITRGGPQY